MKSQKGFSMVEMLVAVAIFSMVTLAGFLLFVAGNNAWSVTDAKIQMQQNLRRALQRITSELQQSGEDSSNNLKVSILDGTGANGSDILRFSIPICVCGAQAMDENGNIRFWGAPVTWLKTGCGSNYPLNGNNKVTICHLPPGNPSNEQTIEVSVNAVKAHLAHGDRLGDCAGCDTSVYNNRTIEYSINNSGQLLRQVLDSSNAVIHSDIFAQNISDFQVSLNGAQTIVTINIQLERAAPPFGLLPLGGSQDVLLRNKN
ncbi:MAG: type II secretion system protein [Candidatus Omnitrophota bacterium]|jgi:prepilin-type N-terminal cleavage/methylation domain-containing protein